ncbi:MAG: hypothetical protein ABI818_10160 [Acidobacteriota bacterium]
MAQQNERPAPQGDPLEEAVGNNPEDNQAQRNSDAPPDAVGEVSERSDREGGRGSDANGVPAFDEADGDHRKKLPPYTLAVLRGYFVAT